MTTKKSDALEKLRSVPEAAWIRKMRGQYAKTRSLRSQDLRRLLGDPKQGIVVGSTEALSKYHGTGGKTRTGDDSA
jgi:hypothetical protein